MKQTAYILVLVLITGFLEIKAQKIDPANVYFQALKLHLDYLDSFNDKRPQEASLITHYFVEQNDYTTDSLPEIINNFTIDVLTRKEIYERTKNKKTLHLIAIMPASWDNGRLVIHVIDCAVSRKRHHYFYENGGGSSFEIIGNNEHNGLNLKIISQGGI